MRVEPVVVSVLLLGLAAIFTPSSCCTTDNDILIDIVFVVDGSGSIGANNFELVKLWLVNATTIMFNKFGQRAQFEILEYSNKDSFFDNVPIEKSTVFEIPFRLGECKNVNCMTSRILNMRYLGLQTYTYYALRRVIEVEFPLSKHYKTAKKAIILLTDGTANDGVFLSDAYIKCVEEDITNFAIGVGNYRLSQLKVFANGGATNERVFTRTNFESMTSVIDSLEVELKRAGFFCDECSSGSHDCHPHADCINLPDGFDCKCKEGYYGDGWACKQIDYCNSNPCKGENTYCVSEGMSYSCSCIEGFRDDGGLCVNIDDCADSNCTGENTVCHDLVGGFMCTCGKGMEWDGSLCIATSDDPSMFVTIFTLIAALVILIVIVSVVAYYTCPRAHKFTVGGYDENVEMEELAEKEEERI